MIEWLSIEGGTLIQYFYVFFKIIK